MSNKTKIWLGVIAISLSSAVIGGVTTAFVIRHKVMHLVEQGPKGVRVLAMRFIGRKLDLSSEQRKQVRPVVKKAQRKLLELRMSHRDEIEVIINEAINEINPHLDQEQQKELQMLRNKLLMRLTKKIN